MSDVRASILRAVEEERSSKLRPGLTGLGALALGLAFLFFVVGRVWQDRPDSFLMVSILWSVAFGAGVFLFFQPQARMEVRGFWSRLVLSKILIVSVLGCSTQLVLCPHFAFLDHQLPGVHFFSYIVEFYTLIAGHTGCLLLCGASFGAITASLGFVWIRRSLSLTHWRAIAWAALCMAVVSLPVGVWQFSQSHHGAGSIFWGIGLVGGILLSAVLVFAFFRKHDVSMAVPGDLRDFNLLYRTHLSHQEGVESPHFFDQGESHLYSDWLLPSCIQTGWDYGDEYYLAGFPDLSEVLEREASNVRVHADIWQEYRRNGLTPLGRLLRKHLRGRVFIDLGSGRIEKSVVPRLLAEEFEAAFYLGVDQNLKTSEIRRAEFQLDESRTGFRSLFFKDSALSFLKSMKPGIAGVVHIAGFELKNSASADSRLEVLEILQELHRILRPGSVLMLGAASHDFQPQTSRWKNDFKVIGQNRYYRLFRRR